MRTADEPPLRAETTVGAPTDRVWAALTDFSRMPEWSPELVRMVPLGRGGLRLGQQYAGVNRRGAVVWPTRNVVTVLEPGRAVGWDTRTSGARWVYRLSGAGEQAAPSTRLTLERTVLRRPLVARAFATALLGGVERHDAELADGMRSTLERIRAAVEDA